MGEMDTAADLYRREAARLRTMASDRSYGDNAKAGFLQIANQYDILAKHHEFLDSGARAWTVEPEAPKHISRAS